MNKTNKGHMAVIVLGYLALLTVALCMVFLILAWLRENSPGEDVAVNAVAEILPMEQKVDLTKAELDAMLERATANAAREREAAVQEASENTRAELLDAIRARLETGDESILQVLRPYYPDDIVVMYGGKFWFLPINKSMKLNTYSNNNLNILENGEYQYLENGQVISYKGIDVSSYQGKIDWQAAAADGVEFTFIRAAYRGYGTKGKLVEDTEFDNNMSGALAAGVHVGIYIYSQAITEEEAREEADLMLNKLAPYGVKCPIVFDVEKTAASDGRMNQLSTEERTAVAAAFCQAVEDAGYTPILYHNMEMATMMIDIGAFEQYDKWFAYYSEDMYYPYAYKIWQYSDHGAVKGIKTDVDLNICFEPFWE